MRKLLVPWAMSLVVLTGAIVLLGCASASGAEGADPHAVAGSEEGQAAEEHHAEGAPLNFKTDLALWSVVTFLVFLLLLKKFAWAPLIEGLDKRESRIRQDLADAEAARVKSEQLLAEHEQKLAQVHEEVREIIAEARRDAEHTKNDILEHAQKEADAARQQAVQDIQRARDHALKELFDFTAGQVVAATEHVLGRTMTDDDQDRLVQEALAEVAGPSAGS